MISEEYKQQLEQLHEGREDFGKRGSRWASGVMQICGTIGTQDVLDYGCGKGELALHLPFAIQEYDPGIPKYDKRPEPADVVVCTDVLEHIEPEHLTAVLDDIRDLTKKACLFNIATREAVKTLPDGRNAHLIVAPAMFWLRKLDDMNCWRFDSIVATEGEVTTLGVKNAAT